MPVGHSSDYSRTHITCPTTHGLILLARPYTVLLYFLTLTHRAENMIENEIPVRHLSTHSRPRRPSDYLQCYSTYSAAHALQCQSTVRNEILAGLAGRFNRIFSKCLTGNHFEVWTNIPITCTNIRTDQTLDRYRREIAYEQQISFPLEISITRPARR